jgi:DNA-binding transcriptional regulator YiaG
MIPEIPETEIPAMSPLDVNAVVVMGLEAATAGVVEIWKAEGAFLPPRYDESTKQNILNWTPGNGSNLSAVYQLAVHFVYQGREAKARAERDAAWKRQRAAQQDQKEAYAAEASRIREAMGLTQVELSVLLGVKPSVIVELEGRRGGSFGLNRVTELLDKYRVQAKLQGKPAKPKGETPA